jgi:hypothetical protein
MDAYMAGWLAGWGWLEIMRVALVCLCIHISTNQNLDRSSNIDECQGAIRIACLHQLATLMAACDVCLTILCRVDLHMQAADKAEAPEEDRARLNDTREAGKRFFLSQETSVYITAARLFPFMIPVIRLLAYRFPDKALVRKRKYSGIP